MFMVFLPLRGFIVMFLGNKLYRNVCGWFIETMGFTLWSKYWLVGSWGQSKTLRQNMVEIDVKVVHLLVRVMLAFSNVLWEFVSDIALAHVQFNFCLEVFPWYMLTCPSAQLQHLETGTKTTSSHSTCLSKTTFGNQPIWNSIVVEVCTLEMQISEGW